MKKTLTVLLLSFLFMGTSKASDPKLSYKLSFDEAYAHYVDVQMNVSGINDEAFIVKMPVWAPGSYLIREFARNVEGFEAYAGDKKLKTEKVRKNAWKIYGA